MHACIIIHLYHIIRIWLHCLDSKPANNWAGSSSSSSLGPLVSIITVPLMYSTCLGTCTEMHVHILPSFSCLLMGVVEHRLILMNFSTGGISIFKGESYLFHCLKWGGLLWGDSYYYLVHWQLIATETENKIPKVHVHVHVYTYILYIINYYYYIFRCHQSW